METKIGLVDLYNEDAILTISKVDQLNTILNQEPNPKWVKIHPHIKNHAYLPIDKVEFLLKRIFKEFRIEVIDTGMLLNAVKVTVRVHYLHPVTNKWEFHDGVGAAEIQTQSGSGCLKMDMSNINKGAVSMALPIAKTIAVKDACDHFGKIFGSDLNRKESVAFIGDDKLQTKAQELSQKLTSKLLNK